MTTTQLSLLHLPPEVLLLVWGHLDYESLLCFVECFPLDYTGLLVVLTDERKDMKRLKHVDTLCITLLRDINLDCCDTQQSLLTAINASEASYYFQYRRLMQTINTSHCFANISGARKIMGLVSFNCPAFNQLTSSPPPRCSTLRIHLSDFYKVVLSTFPSTRVFHVELSRVGQFVVSTRQTFGSMVYVTGEAHCLMLVGSEGTSVFESLDFSGLCCEFLRLDGMLKQLKGKTFQCREVVTVDEETANVLEVHCPDCRKPTVIVEFKEVVQYIKGEIDLFTLPAVINRRVQ